ncbi:uncharacterized protein EV420DRAFT_1643757 [Desarmillaria tabescens]|uniref:Uncharacterized protein n=1 Tax=Armillaria tabescens TaxID=1929756 RepID=A0AA39N4X7_ARMTA|nr:uncharacterized protein EV420DRAFT_1643757 [Desarmillaria tabescens]KAK0457415.1 hypothetical protein EV420DRAFT_1643757 [Desarmillaria tabescens]
MKPPPAPAFIPAKGPPSYFVQETLVPEPDDDDQPPPPPPDLNIHAIDTPYIPLSIDNIPVAVPDVSFNPAESEAATERWKLRVDSMLREIADGKDVDLDQVFKELMEQCDKFNEDVTSSESPSTRDARLQMEGSWVDFIHRVLPNVPAENAWDPAVVAIAGPKFMFFLASHLFLAHTTKPRATDKKVIKSRTLVCFMNLFLHLVLRYTTDPVTKKKCGLQLLTKYNLFQKLKDQVQSLIFHLKLDRHFDKRWFFGRLEIQLVIDTAMKSRSTRLVKINTMMRILFPFYMTTRPSTLGPMCREYRDLGFAHNISFCVASWMMAYLFAIEAFETKFKTLGEMFAFKGLEYPLDPAMSGYPVFPAAKPGGREFIIPYQACSSGGISESIGGLLTAAELPMAGGYALRREAGDTYGMMLSARIARDILKHVQDGCFREHYSRDVENYDVVLLRNNEVDGISVPINQQDYISAAVQAVIRRGKEPEQARRKSSKQDKDAYLMTVDCVVAAKQALDEAWESYYAVFTPRARKYKLYNPRPETIGRLYDIATGARPSAKYKFFELAEGMTQDDLDAARDLTKEKSDEYYALRKKYGRKYTEATIKTRTVDFLEGTAEGSTEEADEALVKLREVCDFAKPIVYDTANVDSVDKDEASLDTDVDFGQYGDPKYRANCSLHKLLHLVDPSSYTADSLLEQETNASNFQPAATNIDEDDEKDLVELPVTLVRERFIAALLEPVLQERELRECKDSETKRWKCKRCVEYVHRTAEQRNVSFTHREKLKRHLDRLHCPWRELELKMVAHWNPDSNELLQYRCPCGGFEYTDIDVVHQHMVSVDCPQFLAHRIMLEEYNKLIEWQDDAGSDDEDESDVDDNTKAINSSSTTNRRSKGKKELIVTDEVLSTFESILSDHLPETFPSEGIELLTDFLATAKDHVSSSS